MRAGLGFSRLRGGLLEPRASLKPLIDPIEDLTNH